MTIKPANAYSEPDVACRQFVGRVEGNMADVVNLKRFKKRSEREKSEKQAEVNRARFGRTKSERVLDELRTERANALLDQHRIDSEDAP